MATPTQRPPAASRPSSGKATRDFLAEVSSSHKPKPAGLVFYGPPGVGKTSMGAAIPGCIFLHDSQEEGLLTLQQSQQIASPVPSFPAVGTWADAMACLKALRDREHQYSCLVIDALGGLERLCHEHVCLRDFHGDWGDRGFASYQKGYEVALGDWRELLNLLDELRTKRQMRIVLLAHSQVKQFRNPYGEDYDRYVPDCHHKTWAITHKWADAVLFLNYYVVVDQQGSRAKGRGGQERIIYTEYHAAYEAKNRYGLPDEIPMGSSGQEAWDNFVNALKAANKKGGQA